jgi:hypothetical protein
MSIDKVEVTNVQGNLLTLTLDDISNGYVVEEIEGLGPVKASIVSSSFATMDGQPYQSSRREGRNVTMKLGYAPNYSINQTIRSLRSRLYQYFMSDNEITLTFYMEDGLTVTTAGRVEACEPVLFTAEPQMNISILCPDADFLDVETTQIHDVFDITDTEASDIVLPEGTTKTGLTLLTFTAPAALDGFSIYHTTPGGSVRSMLITAPLEVNDVVRMCTIKGQKSITLTRTGVTSSLLWAVSPQSQWVLLESGTNGFYLNASEEDEAPVLIDFVNRYGGL